MTKDKPDIVFLSYAREDRAFAERLYMDLRKQEINVWMDVKNLQAGSNWKMEISKTIRKARFFLLLISKNSINKRGFVQKEIKEGLDVFQEFPEGEIFIIPVRLDETEPIDKELKDLNWVNLYPNYHNGLGRILSVFVDLQKDPLEYGKVNGTPTAPVKVLNKGEEITIEEPLMLGERASISYAPFRTATEFLQQFFDRLPTDHIFTDKSLSYYITVLTQHPELQLGKDLLEKYPTHITLVLQNAFRELQVREKGITIKLFFNGVGRTIAIPYEAIVEISVREIGLRITIEQSTSWK